MCINSTQQARRASIKERAHKMLRATPFIINPIIYEEVLHQAWKLAESHVRGVVISDIESDNILIKHKNDNWVYHIYCHDTDYPKLSGFISNLMAVLYADSNLQK